MRTYLWISVTAASLALLGCAEDGTRPPETNNTTPNISGSNTTATSGANNTTGANSTATNNDTGRTTVSKPALGGGNTPATSATDGATTSTPRTGTATSGTNATPPDNSAVNERDRDNDKLLPTDQSNDQKDLDLSAKIRQNILRNKEMSLKAQNVKIITTDDGKVTLRGPVASEDEKKTVEQIAHDAAGGADKVTSELEVAPE